VEGIMNCEKIINKMLPSLCDGMQIYSCNINELIICGSFDFCYYHNLEIIFYEPSFFSLPVSFHTDNLIFRIGNNEERNNLMKEIETDNSVFIFENEENSYFVFAQNVQINQDTVFYYKRENLKPNERIADWVEEHILR
jgi:hypothetical protein